MYFTRKILNNEKEENYDQTYLGNPKYTIEVLQKYGFVFQKRFGQNFLIDTHVLDKIELLQRSPKMILYWRLDRESER